MKLSTMINTISQAQHNARRLEELGYDAIFTNESKHDPFLMAALSADRTSKVEIMTYIAVAFARTPMVVAHSAHDVTPCRKVASSWGWDPKSNRTSHVAFRCHGRTPPVA